MSVVALVIIVTAGLFWFYRGDKDIATKSVSSPSVNTSYVTYKNDKQGYTLSYPNGWYAYTSDSADAFFQPDQEVTGSIPGPHASGLEVKVTTIKANQTLADILKNRPNIANVKYSQQDISIGGVTGAKVVSECDGLGCGVPAWFVINKGHLYYFNSNLGYTADFDKIVASFEFVK